MPIAGFPQFGKFDRPSADADRMLIGQVVDSANALSALARVNCSAPGATINSTTARALPGATVTFTPSLNVLALVTATFDCLAVTAGQNLIGELLVNTVAQEAGVRYAPNANGERATLSQCWAIELTAGVATTLALQARLQVGGANYSIIQTNTGFTVLLVPR